jgi:DNA-directed RNA polymerase beta subunit
MFCPAETPEGAKIGIAKNFAFLTIVSNNITDEEYQILIRNVRDSAEEGKQLIKGELTPKKEQKDEGTLKKEYSTMKK